MIAETECGAIMRQEAVSMIPPLLLDVQAHHKVLDMCAAPGSKTSQLIEMLHSTNRTPDGVVVANDSNNKRCYLMTHQVKRLLSPNVVIVNHDASAMPNLMSHPSPNNTNTTSPLPPPPRPLVYDRILCDVPCSGDATLRKNYEVWRKWSVGGARSLHDLQFRILIRGLELLANEGHERSTVGGRLVYSTCSFNPIENEAVVAAALRKCDASIELVDVSNQLPNLKRRPGLSTWKVLSRNLGDVARSDLSEKLQSCFPPTPEEAAKFSLSRCIRIVPHDQDTGGFFVAVIRKTSELPWKKDRVQTETVSLRKIDEEQKNDDTAPPATGVAETEAEVTKEVDKSPAPKKARYHGFKEDPWIFFKRDEPCFEQMRSFYGFSDAFSFEQVFVRNAESTHRTLYFASKLARDIVANNQERVKVISCGIRLFARSTTGITKSECSYRINQEGVDVAFKFLLSRRITINATDLVTLLRQESPWFDQLTPEFQERLKPLSLGSFLAVYEPPSDANREQMSTERGKVEDLQHKTAQESKDTENSESSDHQSGLPTELDQDPSVPGPKNADDDSELSWRAPACPIRLAAWRGSASCRCYITKHDRAHLLRLCNIVVLGRSEKLKKPAAVITEDVQDDEAANAEDAPDDEDETSVQTGSTEMGDG